MPVLQQTTYSPPRFLNNGHALTIWPNLFRKVDYSYRQSVRLETADDDFIDIDLSYDAQSPPSEKVVILSHGLEGHSHRPYMLGMTKALAAQGWHVVARNFRSCSGVPNKAVCLYHSGETEDLDLVVRYCLNQGYTRIALVGFSMGGNQTLKYLGERVSHPALVGSVVFSVPCDLVGSAERLSHFSHRLYMYYFMRSLRAKVKEKALRYPEKIDPKDLERVRTFKEFDERFTAPLHGFTSAMDYWTHTSSLRFLSGISVPTLLVNAKDDPFLSPKCYPEKQAAEHAHLHLEQPEHGGHTGFVTFNTPLYWSEQRTVNFLETLGF